MQEFLNVKDVKVIRMFRRNHLKTVISQMRAEEYARQTEAQTGTAQWGVRITDKPLPPSKIDISVMSERIETIKEDQEDLRAMYFRTCIDVYYEELNADLNEELQRVSEFLGVDFDPDFTPPFRKATPDDLTKAITNFSEVENWMKESSFESGFLGIGS